MSIRKPKVVCAVTLLVAILAACNALSPEAEPTQIIESASTPSQQELPRSAGEVPRVTVEAAKAALDSGEAIIMDVRNAEAYQSGHITGAVHMPLDEIESNPAGLKLDQEQWILTYCT